VKDFMPDGLLDELANLPPEEKRDRPGGRGGRDRDRDRGPRGRSERGESRDRGPRRERSEEAPVIVEAVASEAAAAVDMVAEAPIARDEAPKRERGPRSDKRRERGDKPRPERAERPEQQRMERTERTDRVSDKRERPSRDFKRKDDDLILEPAPDKVKGFGSDVPSFLKKR
jgi:hypothetical protein